MTHALFPTLAKAQTANKAEAKKRGCDPASTLYWYSTLACALTSRVALVVGDDTPQAASVVAALVETLPEDWGYEDEVTE
jgi:hypothetical protein